MIQQRSFPVTVNFSMSADNTIEFCRTVPTNAVNIQISASPVYSGFNDLAVSFSKHIDAALFLVTAWTTDEEQAEAARFKMFWGGE